MPSVLENIKDLAAEVFLVDSYSTDDTTEIAQTAGVHVVQHSFSGFGDQWNFALKNLPITAPWTMKLDPDERITPELATSIRAAMRAPKASAYSLDRQLWFMGRAMPVHQKILRIWRTGTCRFSDVLVNEHPIVDGVVDHLTGVLAHHDSPNLQHWFEKQNRYTSAEATTIFEGRSLAASPGLFGNSLERRMWLKRIYRHIPFRHTLMFLYCYLWLGAWKSGRVGLNWSRLRSDVYRQIDYKVAELMANESVDSDKKT